MAKAIPPFDFWDSSFFSKEIAICYVTDSQTDETAHLNLVLVFVVFTLELLIFFINFNISEF